jgi:hypothetical protein
MHEDDSVPSVLSGRLSSLWALRIYLRGKGTLLGIGFLLILARALFGHLYPDLVFHASASKFAFYRPHLHTHPTKGDATYYFGANRL